MVKRLSLFLLVLFVFSCSNDFNTAADWKEIAIIYGLLDQRNTKQYLVVQRAFLDAEGNNLIGLTEPDSIFFTNDISVELSEIKNDQIISIYPLQLVNGNNIGIIKEEGVFPQDPNWLFEYDKPLDFLSEYELNIHNNVSGNQYSAKTKVIQDFEIIDFFANSGINLNDGLDNTISWFSADNAAVFQIKLMLHYSERDTSLSNPIVVEKTIERILNKQIEPVGQGSTVNFNYEDEQFFSILSQSIQINTKMERCFKYVDIVVSAGSEDLFKMIQSQQAQSGITEIQIQPNYSNIEGDDAIGIFASRTGSRIDSIRLTAASIQAIVENPLTAPLQFLPSSCN